jgi:spore germination protein KC
MHCKSIFVAIFAVLSVLMVGCRMSRETDEIAFIIAMGIDKAEQGKIKITFQIAIPRAAGGLQGTGQEVPGGPTLINSIVAPDIAEARNLLTASMSRYANLSHMRAILISEELARSGIGDIIAPLQRYREYRGGVFLCVVRGRADDFMVMNKPKLDYLPSKFFESFEFSSEQSSFHLRADLHDFYIRLKEQGASPYATYIGMNPLTGKDTPAGEKLPNEKANTYLAGDMPRTGTESPAEFVGTCVFSGGKMVGTLDSTETRMLAMLKNDFPRGFWVQADPLQPEKEINVNLRNGSKPKVDVVLLDGKECIKVTLFLEGEITSIPSGINYEKAEYREMLEKEISNWVTQNLQDFIRHTQQLGSDVVGFGYHLRSQITTYDKLQEANLEELYKTANVEVEVTTRLRRTGLMWRSSPYKPTATTQ